jgi:chromate reductase, NAD(P)H dehydrogenase (quinone)
MSSSSKILAFAGSARKDSFNKRLIQVAARMTEQAGAEVTLIDLADYPLPLFNEDVEAEGTPENATRLKALFLAHNGLLISAPEYNSSITPLLKNTIDWVSRPVQGEPSLAAYRGKTAGLLSASPGAFGGMRGLVHLRDILGNIGVLVVPSEAAISQANQAFDDAGELKDAKQRSRVEAVVRALVETTGKLLN